MKFGGNDQKTVAKPSVWYTKITNTQHIMDYRQNYCVNQMVVLTNFLSTKMLSDKLCYTLAFATLSQTDLHLTLSCHTSTRDTASPTNPVSPSIPSP